MSVKITAEERSQIDVFIALANYNYDLLEKKNSAHELLKRMHELDQRIQKKFPKPQIYEFEQLDLDLKADRLSEKPKLSYRDGWVFVEHIEHLENPPYPYKSREKKRYNYLNNPLIESAKFTYKVRRKTQGQKNRVTYSKTVYRLKRDKKSKMDLLEIFLIKPFMKVTEEQQDLFLHSVYMRDVLYSDKSISTLIRAYASWELLGHYMDDVRMNTKILTKEDIEEHLITRFSLIAEYVLKEKVNVTLTQDDKASGES